MASEAQPHMTPRLLLLLFGAWTGPIAWTLHLVISYVLVPFSCSVQSNLPLHLTTLVMALPTAAAAVVSFVLWRQSGVGMEADTGDETGEGVVRLRSGFSALVGLLLSLMFLLLIIAEGLGPFFLSPCPTEGLT